MFVSLEVRVRESENNKSCDQNVDKRQVTVQTLVYGSIYRNLLNQSQTIEGNRHREMRINK